MFTESTGQCTFTGWENGYKIPKSISMEWLSALLGESNHDIWEKTLVILMIKQVTFDFHHKSANFINQSIIERKL